MMKFHKLAKFSLAAMASLVVAACGSSGGNSQSAPTNDIVTPSQPSTATPTAPTQPNVTTPSQPSTDTPTAPTQPNVATPSQPSTTTQTAPTQPNVTVPSQPSTDTPTAPTQPNVATPSQPSVATPAETTQPTVSETTPPASVHPKDLERNNPTDGNLSGFAFTWKKAGSNVQIASISSENTDADVNKLNVEGNDIDIIPPLNTRVPNGNWVQLLVGEEGNRKPTRIVSGYANTRWGLISEPESESIYIVSVGKNATDSMPSSGVAHYVGNALHIYSSGEENRLNTNTRGKVNLDADFGNKTLVGTITPEEGSSLGGIPKVDLSAQISGNTFVGGDDVQTSGGFYGKNAEEVIGRYSKVGDNGYLGVFGAKKE